MVNLLNRLKTKKFKKLKKKVIDNNFSPSLAKIVGLASLPVVNYSDPISPIIDSNAQLLPYTTYFTGNTELKTICDTISKYCGTYEYIAETNLYVMSDQYFVRLMENAEKIVGDVSIQLDKSIPESAQMVGEVITKKQWIIQPKGFSGFVYKSGQFLQTYGSMQLVTISLMRNPTLTGVALVQSNPLLVVTAPFLIGTGLSATARIVGDNIVGRSCRSMANLFLFPMRFSEWTANAYITPFLNNTIGIPLVFNLTDNMIRGLPGLTPQDMKRIMPNPKAAIPRIVGWVQKLWSSAKP